MGKKLHLNALDQSAICTSGDSQTAIYETVALAQYLDSIGYHRFWLAEHHNTAAFAIAAPEILIAHIAAHTKNLRIGSGGIMLPHYSPLKIAEQFRMLETLAPNRIDLGIGRAPGGDPRTAAALQAGPKAWPIEVFPQQVEVLLQFLQDAAGLTGADGGFAADHPYQGIHAQPVSGAISGAMGGHVLPVWMLGSGGDGAIHAAQFGLPYVYAHFINPDNLAQAAQSYRQNFAASAFMDAPKLAIAISVLVADSQEQADYLARPRNIWAAQLLQNRAGRFPTLAEAQDWQPENQREGDLLAMIQARSLTGTADEVAEKIDALSRPYDVEEIFILTLIPDIEARKTSYRLLSRQFAGEKI